MARSTNPATTRAPGRPRSDVTNEAIVQATLDLLENENYSDVSIDKIANLAKVGKQTIYRRWSSKADLVLDVMAERVFNRSPGIVPSGDARADLRDLLMRYFVQLRHPLANKGFRAIIAEAQLDAAIREKFYSAIVNERRFQIRELLEAGVATGQFRDDADLDLACDMIYGGFWFRFLSGTGAPLDEAYANDVVDSITAYLMPTKA